MSSMKKQSEKMDETKGATTADQQVTKPWRLGEQYLIRTVTMFQTGRLAYVGEHELLLEDAAWIADTGRFGDALAKGTLNEVEAIPDGHLIVGRGSIVDASLWKHPLPRETK